MTPVPTAAEAHPGPGGSARSVRSALAPSPSVKASIPELLDGPRHLFFAMRTLGGAALSETLRSCASTSKPSSACAISVQFSAARVSKAAGHGAADPVKINL
jgi:hypothetical protein